MNNNLEKEFQFFKKQSFLTSLIKIEEFTLTIIFLMNF